MEKKGKKPKNLSEFTTPICSYQFGYFYGASSEECTILQVRHRLAVHLPSWLSKGQVRMINISILAHLVITSHQVYLNKASKVIYRIPLNIQHGLQVHLLHISEAI